MPEILTIRDHISWVYANLARADAALGDGLEKYKQIHHIIRNKVFHGLKTQKMQIRSIYEDERLKMELPQACCYCGSRENLSLDHLIPRAKGGADESDNLVWACRSCNSSKRHRDLMVWMTEKDRFPSIWLLRRYMKIVVRYCEQKECLDKPIETSGLCELPFDLQLLPVKFPPLVELKQWVYPTPENIPCGV